MMKYAKRMSILLAVLMIGAALVAATRGDEYEADEQRMEKLNQELSQIDTTPKVGDEVVALSDTALKVAKQTVATARKGETLTVEQVQDNWLWVRTGQTRGWIESTAVIAPALLAYYQRRPEGFIAQIWGGVRTKINGIAFRIETDGRRTAIETHGSGMSIKGGSMHVVIQKAGDSVCGLSVNGKRHGQARRGDYVFIDPSQKVFVNGRLRRPQ